MMEIRVRKATTDDYSALCELFDEVDLLHRNHLPHIFQRTGGAAREQEYFDGLIADENVALLVAETDQRLVGVIHAVIRDTPAISILVSRRYVIVDAVVIKSEFQKQGLGKMLMGRIDEWALAKGATSIELNVYEFNRSAISFYERLGYRSVSRKMSRQLGKTKGRRRDPNI